MFVVFCDQFLVPIPSLSWGYIGGEYAFRTPYLTLARSRATAVVLGFSTEIQRPIDVELYVLTDFVQLGSVVSS